MTKKAIEPAFIYAAEAVRTIDGDTFVARVDLGFNVEVNIVVRLHGVNAVEHNHPGGKDATRFLDELLNPYDQGVRRAPAELRLQSYHDSMSFARWVCDVWRVEPDGSQSSVAQKVIDSGNGEPFDPKVDTWHR